MLLSENSAAWSPALICTSVAITGFWKTQEVCLHYTINLSTEERLSPLTMWLTECLYRPLDWGCFWPLTTTRNSEANCNSYCRLTLYLHRTHNLFGSPFTSTHLLSHYKQTDTHYSTKIKSVLFKAFSHCAFVFLSNLIHVLELPSDVAVACICGPVINSILRSFSPFLPPHFPLR